MPRRRRKRQAPVELYGKRLVLGRKVQLGVGPLLARLRAVRTPSATELFVVDIWMKNSPGEDMFIWGSQWRNKPRDAVKDVELFLPRLASALRQAGAA